MHSTPSRLHGGLCTFQSTEHPWHGLTTVPLSRGGRWTTLREIGRRRQDQDRRRRYPLPTAHRAVYGEGHQPTARVSHRTGGLSRARPQNRPGVGTRARTAPRGGRRTGKADSEGAPKDTCRLQRSSYRRTSGNPSYRAHRAYADHLTSRHRIRPSPRICAHPRPCRPDM